MRATFFNRSVALLFTGGQMYRRAWASLFVILLVRFSLQAQPPRLSLRAASVQPVDGWQTMQVEHCQGERCIVWVSPTAAITESDIEKAQPEVSPNGDSDTGSLQRIRIFLTDVGAKKLHDLTEAQVRKHIALIVDDKVLWAPTVQVATNAARKESLLAGSTSHGLTDEEVERIVAILRPAEPR